MKTLILGAGNLLLSDEGFGPHFIRHFQANYLLPDEVKLLDAGTAGIMLTHELEAAERVYIVDIVFAEGAPGTILRFGKADILLKRIPVKLSPHQAGVQELLLVSELRGRCPAEISLVGIIPERIEAGIELSPVLQAQLGEVAALLAGELQCAADS